MQKKTKKQKRNNKNYENRLTNKKFRFYQNSPIVFIQKFSILFIS